jgi:hypothetical protein
MNPSLRHFLRHIELYLSLVGLIAIFCAGLIASHYSANVWQVVAIVAVVVGVLHGFIFWAVRSRQRKIRRDDLERARIVLQDVVNNHLMIISLALASPQAGGISVAEAQQSLNTIALYLNRFSEESLFSWERDQARTTMSTLRPGA